MVSNINVASLPGRQNRSLLSTIGEIRRKGFLQFLADEWKAYGDLTNIQIGPRSMVLAVHPEHVRHISITNRDNYDKLESYDVVRELLLGDAILTATGESWRKQRRLMAPFFTPRGIEQFAPIILSDAESTIRRWEGKTLQAQPVEMLDEMMLITASIILKSMFTTQSDESLLEIKDDVETMISFVGSYQNNPLRPPLWLHVGENGRYHRARQRVNAYIGSVIAQRRAMPETDWPNDLLSKLMLARDEETGEALSDLLLRDESITIFFAGHETTARTMTFAWYALARNPDVAARLHEEVDRVLGDRLPTIQDMKQMPYTMQVIKETMRLYPAAPVYARDARTDDIIDGMVIPKGTRLILSPFLTHRHPAFWNDPERFDPDRWLPDAEAVQHPYAYHPFAAGQRICLGNNFSLFESHIILSILARRFAPRLSPASHTPKLVMTGTLGSSNGMPMLIERRV